MHYVARERARERAAQNSNSSNKGLYVPYALFTSDGDADVSASLTEFEGAGEADVARACAIRFNSAAASLLSAEINNTLPKHPCKA